MSYWSGIKIGDVLIHPPEAYIGAVYWLRSVEALLPEKAKEMKAYSDSKGWTHAAHEHNWVPVLHDWYRAQAKREASPDSGTGSQSYLAK